MNKLAREKAKGLIYNAVSNVLIEIRDHTDAYSDKPDDMSFDDYRDLGFSIKKAGKEGDHDHDLWYIGLRVGKVQSYIYDALELMKIGASLYMRANGKTALLITFNKEGAVNFNPNLLLNACERAIIENDELLAAIDALDKGKKREVRKARK